MWASARAELLRPGLSGGGGGRPLWLTSLGATVTGTGATAGAATFTAFADFAGFAGFFVAAGKVLALAGLALATGFATTLTLTFADAAGAFGANLAALEGATLALVLDIGLIVAFGAALALAGFLGTGLDAALTTGFFTTVLDLTTCLAIFLGAGLAATLGAVLGAALSVAFGFTTALPPLATTLAAILTLLAGLFASADFAGFAFTACLLWEAASGWTPAPTPDLASALVFWSARDCSGCPD